MPQGVRIELPVFGQPWVLIESTSPTPGRVCAAVLSPDGASWPDFFMYDPVSRINQYEPEAVQALIGEAFRKRSPKLSLVLRLTQGVVNATRWVRGLFGGSYGGSLGFGAAGGMIAAASAALFVLASLAAALVIVPLLLVIAVLRLHIDKQIKREAQAWTSNATTALAGFADARIEHR